MPSPHDDKDTNICLDDIRAKLVGFEDKQLGLEILEALEKLDSQQREKTAIIAEKVAREATLVDLNNQLFSKVAKYTERDKPSDKVDYEDINRDLSKIIDKL